MYEKICVRCEERPVNIDVREITGRDICVICCIKGYKFVLGKVSSENRDLQKIVDTMRKGVIKV